MRVFFTARLPKLALLIVVALLLVNPFPASALVDTDPTDNIGSSLEEQLDAIERELARLRKSKQDLQSQIQGQQAVIGNYSGEIGKLLGQTKSLELDIATLELQKKELDLTIKDLDERIATKLSEIEENEGTVVDLEKATYQRIELDYMQLRARGRTNVDVLPSQNPNAYFRDSRYKHIIQNETNKAVSDLLTLRAKLETDREVLKESMVESARQKAVVDEQTSQLETAKADLKAKIDSYQLAINNTQANINRTNNVLGVYSDEEARKLAEREHIRQILFNSFASIPAGQYVLADTQIGNQGSTGWSTGPHLHFSVTLNGVSQNPCNLLPGNFVAGCGGNGSLRGPLKGGFYYTSRYYSGVNGDLRCFDGYCHAHPAIDVAHPIWNAPIYAAHDGWLLKGVDEYGALYIIICQNKSNCNSGFKTGYWHLSSY